MTKVLRVNFEGIKNINTGGDAGNELEIYGTILASIDDVKTIFWDTTDNNFVSIAQNNFYPINKSYDLIINENQSIRLGGHLIDCDDTTPDDDMGSNYIEIDYNSLPSINNCSVTELDEIQFSEGDQIVSVKFSYQTIHEF